MSKILSRYNYRSETFEHEWQERAVPELEYNHD